MTTTKIRKELFDLGQKLEQSQAISQALKLSADGGTSLKEKLGYENIEYIATAIQNITNDVISRLYEISQDWDFDDSSTTTNININVGGAK
jgi:hypothetical protein